MAKKKRRPLRHTKELDKSVYNTAQRNVMPSLPRQSATLQHPPETSIETSRGVAMARQKHKYDLLESPIQPVQPTLAHRFHALPLELRSHVFSFLLVHPVKWDVVHSEDCPRRENDLDITPQPPQGYRCATGHWSYTYWRSTAFSESHWTSPWRSEWAPRQLNQYVCSLCWDSRLRPEPHPRSNFLPCLCARRTNLQVLLVCRKWYEEAANVFYTQTVFAFEDCTTFSYFLENLRPIWRDAISKISIMNPSPLSLDQADNNNNNHNLFRAFSLLRTALPSLSHLELDIEFLRHSKSAARLLRLGLTNLKSLRFVERAAAPTESQAFHGGSPSIWPALAARRLIRGGFAEEVARQVKGERQKRLKKRGVLDRSVRIERGEILEI